MPVAVSAGFSTLFSLTDLPANVPDGSILFATSPTWTAFTPTGLPGLNATIIGYAGVWSEYGITSDFLTQYLLMAGRSGGQTLSGGTAASENLTLQSTAHATKGFILLGTGGLVGINQATPAAQLEIVQAVKTTGSPTALKVTGGAHTTLTASTESAFINLDGSAIVQFATGTLALQRLVRIQAQTISFAGASTSTENVTLDISGPPIQGTNATFTGAAALRIKAAPFASSKMGLVSLGDGPWDGVTANKFVGSANGTILAINAASGFVGNVADFQVGGTGGVSISSTGIVLNRTSTGFISAVGNMDIQVPGASTLTLTSNSVSAIKLQSGNITLQPTASVTVADAINFVFNTTTGTKFGTGATQKISFYNAAPVVQQTRGGTLTNNVTSGGTTDQIDNWTDLTLYANDAAAIRNAVYQLSRIVRQHDVALRALGLES